eukprot:PhM_4_TR9363/c0_g1_i1/m.14242
MTSSPFQPMATNVDPTSATYMNNFKVMSQLAAELKQKIEVVCQEGREGDVARHKKRGQLTARERLEAVLDADSPFLELMPFAGFGGGKENSGTRMITGVGVVNGVEVGIAIDIPTIAGGAKSKYSVIKGLRFFEICNQNRLPIIACIQTAGADLTQQHKVFHRGGNTFRMLAQRSKAGLPTISIVFGSSTAGGAYYPGLSDYVIMVKKQAQVYLGGPPLVKMATGQIVGHEELGGAEMHSTVSGVSDYLATDEPQALRIAREIVATLNWTKTTPLPRAVVERTYEEPLYPSEELLGIATASIREPYDISEIIARVVDGSRVHFFKSDIGRTLVCCWATVMGYPVGIIANNGVFFSDSSNKATQFVHLCNQKNTPILFFHNITGFMVGKQSEEGGLIKHGSLFINAISNSGVPHISIVMGASFGAGNYAMNGRAYNPRFLFSWPNAQCSVMGSEQLSGVMDLVMRERVMARLRTKQLDAATEAKLSAQREQYKQNVEKQMSVYFTSGRVIDDGVIDPRDTRTVLGMCLSLVYNAEVKGANVCGISRL